MDKAMLDEFNGRMVDVWGIFSLDLTATDLLLLGRWEEVLKRTVAIFPTNSSLDRELATSVVVTLDGDSEYCVWEAAFLEEAYGTDAWFMDEESAIEHARELAQERFLETI